MRKSLIIAACIVSLQGFAQDQDLYIIGTLTDRSTGEVLPLGEVRVHDLLDTAFQGTYVSDIKGRVTVPMLTGALNMGGYYVVLFSAPGYRSRQATIDASQVQGEITATTAWRITMDVALMPDSTVNEEGDAEFLLGTCRYDRKKNNFVWEEATARKLYSSERYDDPRIPLHTRVIEAVDTIGGFLVDGVLKDYWTEQAIVGAEVVARGDSTVQVMMLTDTFGYYAFILPPGQNYLISYSAEGRVTKSLEMDLRPLTSMVDGGYRASVDMYLFDPVDGVDLRYLDNPVGKGAYDPKTDQYQWDMEYSRPILERLEEDLRRARMRGQRPASK